MSAQLDGWTPVRVGWAQGEPFLEWARLGARRYVEPFFEQTIDLAVREPFNLAFRMRTSLETLLDVFAEDAPMPAGLIFHMSHCGSTLIAQMLAAVERNVVLSEAAPLDAVVWMDRRLPHLNEGDQARYLRAMAAALANGTPGGDRAFVKWNVSHALRLPLIARAFPGVPWVFVFRDPVEVLVAQARRWGPEFFPGAIPPGMLGLRSEMVSALPIAEYAARALAAVCDAALGYGEENGGGLFVHYRDLPEATFSRVVTHFGLAYDDAEITRMRAAGYADAKRPGSTFHPDGEEKRRAATAVIRALAAAFLERPFEAMLRASAATAR